MLFAPSLLGLFGFVAHSPLHDSMWLFGLCITLLVGSFVPFIFFWASLTCLLSLGFLGPFAFLGLPWPFFLTLRSHGLLLTPLGFPGPITLSFIFGAHGLAINPLLSLLALLRACCDPFSLFYITYYPWVYYFYLSELL